MPETPDPTPTPPAPTPEPTPPGTEPEPAPTPVADEPLGEGGLRALAAERERANTAEKDARAAKQEASTAKRRAADLEREKLSETEKLKHDAEHGRKLAATATERLREVNLLTALHGQGIVGQQAKAAAKLLDSVDVEYDDSEEPTNLADAVAAAKAAYGEAYFVGARPAPTPEPPPTPMPGHPQHPDFYGGPRPPAPDADEDEKYAAYMTANFPQMRKQEPVQSPNGPG